MHLQLIPDIQIIEETETKLEPLYRVIIHNANHVTPMDSVVHVLKNCFYLSNSKAADIMLAAHVYGTARLAAPQTRCIPSDATVTRKEQTHVVLLIVRLLT